MELAIPTLRAGSFFPCLLERRRRIDQALFAVVMEAYVTGDDWIARRVSAVGVVCVAWQQISVGKHRAGRTVDVQVGEEILHIGDGNELLKTVLRDNRKEIPKKRASVASLTENRTASNRDV